MAKKNQTALERYQQVMVPNYAPMHIVPESGEGIWLSDLEGKKYLDMGGGIAVTGLGHSHPKVVAALKAQAEKLWHVSNYYASVPAIELAELLTGLTGFDRAFFCNSGSEAVEASLKIARRYCFDQYGPEKNEIISFHKSFHGRSLFTVTAGGQSAYRKGFGPLPAQMTYGHYNNIEDLTKLVNQHTCAIIMEPVMAEGGVYPASPEFAQAARALADEHKALLVFDEVQSGIGRTGSLFCYEQLGMVPDIVASAKALGSGFPIGAMLTTDKIAQTFQPGTHGSTFGGNLLGCAVAKASVEEIAKPETLANVNSRGAQLCEGLRKLGKTYNLFAEIRSTGLLVGAELSEAHQGKAKDFVTEGLNQGLMMLVAGPNVLRFAPSLIITESEVNQALDLLELTIKSVLSNP